MTPTDLPRPLRCAIGLLLGLRLTFAAAAAAWLATSTICHPEVIDYEFSNATTVLNGVPETISGLVSFCCGGSEPYAVIQLAGAAPYAGLYFAGVASPLCSASCIDSTGGSDTFLAFGFGTPFGTLRIRFANDLSFATDPLASVEIGGVTDAAPTGVAVAVATPIHYVFSNASTVLNGTPESITGGFTYDPLTLVEYPIPDGFSPPISFTGPPPYAGSCFFDTELIPPGNAIQATCPPFVGNTSFQFAHPLSSTADPLVFVSGFPATGEAVPISGGPLPEPPSFALLGGALGLFLLSLRAIRRASQRGPDQPEGA
jgi:hypothetical protein